MTTFVTFWQAMRRRPEMYLGPADGRRRLQLIRSILGMLRDANGLTIELLPSDQLLVLGTGAGISLHQTEQHPYAGGGDVFLVEVSKDLARAAQDGIGLLLARGFSKRLEVHNVSQRKRALLVTMDGELQQPLAINPSDEPDRIEIKAWLDTQAIGDPSPSPQQVANLARDIAESLKILITLRDRRADPDHVQTFEQGAV